jgi:hypothetical protein
MLCGLPVMEHAAIGNCLSIDPLPFDQNGLLGSLGTRSAADVRHVVSLTDFTPGGDTGGIAWTHAACIHIHAAVAKPWRRAASRRLLMV